MTSGVPAADTPVPDQVAQLAGSDPVRAVWANELGGLVFEIGTGTRRRFAKWAPRDSGIRFAPEIARLRWAIAYTPVPEVIDHGLGDDGEWLLTRALPGRSAVDPYWLDDPATAATAIGVGLRAMHDRLPVDDCPFDWTAETRVATFERSGRHDPTTWSHEFRQLDLETVRARLADPPPVDLLVVCHGDACSPNTLLDDEGQWVGHVDLGALGQADRWADLAVATWATTWNYGPGWEQTLLDAYGVDADPVRTDYYRLLWDVSP
ncbi:MAG TPA: aminoglycoside 3'-phosphotransferase [Jatrophihabitantaceae bacterium]|nr:aminoglycoside 3'-phosphotransferase [Jatrophihabitantaceae bacterium]